MHFRLRTLLLAVTALALLLSLILFRDAFPGTYYRDRNGFSHGTGQAEHFYDNDSLMIRERYYRGLIYQATWYKPNGTKVATESYDRQSGGIGYYLRQDGSLKSKYTYEYSRVDNLYAAAGPPVYYDRNGQPVPDATEPIE